MENLDRPCIEPATTTIVSSLLADDHMRTERTRARSYRVGAPYWYSASNKALVTEAIGVSGATVYPTARFSPQGVMLEYATCKPEDAVPYKVETDGPELALLMQVLVAGRLFVRVAE